MPRSRRVCPGRWLAYDSVWIAAASMLAAYNIIPATDENGITIRPKEEVTTGLLRYFPQFFHLPARLKMWS